nr:helix-turn-helix domain-containing protein [Streptomyces sp. MMG1533]
MRYAQGGGLTDAGRAARERIRLQAVERFEGGEKNREIATALRVSERSVETVRITFSGSVRRGFRLPDAATGTSTPALPIRGAFSVV